MNISQSRSLLPYKIYIQHTLAQTLREQCQAGCLIASFATWLDFCIIGLPFKIGSAFHWSVYCIYRNFKFFPGIYTFQGTDKCRFLAPTYSQCHVTKCQYAFTDLIPRGQPAHTYTMGKVFPYPSDRKTETQRGVASPGRAGLTDWVCLAHTGDFPLGLVVIRRSKQVNPRWSLNCSTVPSFSPETQSWPRGKWS